MKRAFVGSVLFGVLLLAAAGPTAFAGPGLAPFMIPDVSMAFELTTPKTNYNAGPLAFNVSTVNNTPQARDVQLIFGPPLAGKMIHLPARPQGSPAAQATVQTTFSDPAGLPFCAERTYSAEAQTFNTTAIQITNACTFKTSIQDAWSQESPDRQTGSVYVDNPKVDVVPTCALSGGLRVTTTVYNNSKISGKGMVVQLLDATNTVLAETPAFDLKADSTASKTLTVPRVATGKIQVFLADPKHTVTGVLGNPGVFVVVAPACTLETKVLPAAGTATLVTTPR